MNDADHNVPHPADPRLLESAEGLERDGRRRFLFSAMAGAGILAGCGGGSDEPEFSSAPGVGEPAPGVPPSVTEVRFTTKDRQILRNGVPYYAQGMCYSPQPVGATFDGQPWGDFFMDFWAPVFERDLPAMRAMGVNSLRLYSTLPFELIYDENSERTSHALFLDACEDAGMTVWVGFPIDGGVYRTRDPKQMARTREGVRLLAEQLADHPAVMGFIIGNESNIEGTRNRDDYWAWINDLARVCKSLAPGKLTMTSTIDDGLLSIAFAEQRGLVSQIDVFGINTYRGSVSTGMGSLFTDYARLSRRPLLITEFGCPASTRLSGDTGVAVELPDRAALQAKYLQTQWEDMVRDGNRAINSGGYVFAWSDEWWKSASPAVHNVTHRSAPNNPQFPGGYWDEEWFGINAIAPNPLRADNPANPVNGGVHHPDVLTPRAAVDMLTTLWASK